MDWIIYWPFYNKRNRKAMEMAVRTLKRSKMICDGACYVWHVKEDADYPCYVLRVISADKQFILSYPLGGNVPK